MPALNWSARPAVVLAVLLCLPLAAQDALRKHEPNTRVPAGVVRFAPSVFPDRIVASPALP